MPNYDSPGMAGHKPDSPDSTERGYNLGKWRDFDRALCIHCPFECWTEGEMKEHIFQRHVNAEAIRRMAERPIEARLFDGSGNLIDSIDADTPRPGGRDSEPEAFDLASPALLEELEKELLRRGMVEKDATDND